MKNSIHFDHVSLKPSEQIGSPKETDTQRRLKQIEIYISCNYRLLIFGFSLHNDSYSIDNQTFKP